MAEKPLNQVATQELLKIPGSARGLSIQDEFDYILKKYGPEGLRKLEETLLQRGLPLKRDQIRPLDFYPVGQEAVVLLTIRDVFGFADRDFEEMGAKEAKLAFLLKLLGHFISLRKVAEQTPGLWRKHYLEGNLSVPTLEEEKGFLVLRLENFKLHPLHCRVLQGYFSAAARLVVRQPIKAEETRCPFRGDPWHEYLLTWKTAKAASEELKPEAVQKLLMAKGEARGIVFKTDAEYVSKRWGQAGLNKLEQRLKELGQDWDYSAIDDLRFYPLGQRAVSLLAIQDCFGLSVAEIQEIGEAAPKFSLLIKTFVKYFFSLEKTVEQASTMWQKHYTVGQLQAVELNERARRVVLRLTGLDLHPLFCRYLAGYFATVLRLVVGKRIQSQETECTFRGGQHHDFLLTWSV